MNSLKELLKIYFLQMCNPLILIEIKIIPNRTKYVSQNEEATDTAVS